MFPPEGCVRPCDGWMEVRTLGSDSTATSRRRCHSSATVPESHRLPRARGVSLGHAPGAPTGPPPVRSSGSQNRPKCPQQLTCRLLGTYGDPHPGGVETGERVGPAYGDPGAPQRGVDALADAGQHEGRARRDVRDRRARRARRSRTSRQLVDRLGAPLGLGRRRLARAGAHRGGGGRRDRPGRLPATQVGDHVGRVRGRSRRGRRGSTSAWSGCGSPAPRRRRPATRARRARRP